MLCGAKTVLNVYGIEIWTDLSKTRAAALRRMDFLISDCQATLDYALQQGLHAPEHTAVHRDCVDLERFSPGDPGDVLQRHGVPREEGVAILMTLGRMAASERYKGMDRLIEVYAGLSEALHLRTRLVLVGDGDDRPRLQDLAAKSGVGDRIHFTGRVHEEDLPAVYRACDVFSLVTHRGDGAGEGLPLTPIEAAACGKPILVGNQDGSREAAEDGVSGFVLDPFDLDAIRERLTRLFEDDGLRESMGQKALERVRGQHGFGEFVELTGRVLEKLATT